MGILTVVGDFVTDMGKGLSDFKDAIEKSDISSATKATLDMAKASINAGIEGAEYIGKSMSPLAKKVIGKVNLVGSFAEYELTLAESLHKDSEKEFIKKQIAGLVGVVFGSSAQDYVERKYDAYDIGGAIGLSDTRTMADNLDYLKGKSVDDWMRLFGITEDEAIKAKKAIDEIPESVLVPKSEEPTAGTFTPPSNTASSMVVYYSNRSQADRFG
ncbi:hypothetical protein [Citrobacter tructae]|uniref:hypothetical protein n=1 Tax=Citrobacter tructae TaxID=2562449 RepID=UPI003F553CED